MGCAHMLVAKVLIFGGRILANAETIADTGLSDKTTLHMVIRSKADPACVSHWTHGSSVTPSNTCPTGCVLGRSVHAAPAWSCCVLM